MRWLGKYSRILDFGCGPGDITARLSRHAKKAYGVDLYEADIRKAKELYPNIDFRAVKGRLPFPDGFFDAACAFEVLEHTDGHEAEILVELNRVLKTGGELFVTVPHRGLLWGLDPLNYRAYFPFLERIFPSKSNRTGEFHRHYTLSQMQKILRNAGFRTVGVNYAGISPIEPFGIVMWSLAKRNRLAKLVYDGSKPGLDAVSRTNFGGLSYGIAVKAVKLKARKR